MGSVRCELRDERHYSLPQFSALIPHISSLKKEGSPRWRMSGTYIRMHYVLKCEETNRFAETPGTLHLGGAEMP
jgi:hypothetical protein